VTWSHVSHPVFCGSLLIQLFMSTSFPLQGNSWVVTRSSTLARRYRTKGVVHFVGGAFAGAAPQVMEGS
jgi:hypothetical protein